MGLLAYKQAKIRIYKGCDKKVLHSTIGISLKHSSFGKDNAHTICIARIDTTKT